MRNALRLVLAASVLSSASFALYACSSEDTTNNGGTDGGAESSTGSDSGTDSSTGSDGGSDGGSKSCAILDDNASIAPKFSPQACKDCLAEKCCAGYTKCYGAAPADAGLDGSDGKKTNCVLFGECSDTCYATDGGGDPINVCEAKCVSQYGQPAADDYSGAWGCYDQCQTFCP
jgi:hypothetical protein